MLSVSIFCSLPFCSLLVSDSTTPLHLISFIIPCYNCAKTVVESIESIYQQNLSFPFEVICTDDGSVDNTRMILENCAKTFPNLFVYFHSQNRGGGAARNTCTLHSHGDLIFNLDSDNVLVPNSIAELVYLLDETKCDAASFAFARFFDGTYMEAHRWNYSLPGNVVDLFTYMRGGEEPFSQGNYLYTRKAFDAVGGYLTNCGALDTTAFGLSLLAAGFKIAINPNRESFYWHRTSPHSYYAREEFNNSTNFQKAVRHISEVFPSHDASLFEENNLDAFNRKWRRREFTLASTPILESLFKAYEHKKECRYAEAAMEFSNAIKLGCKSPKIRQFMEEAVK